MTARNRADPALVERIEEHLREPIYFRDILDATRDQKYRAILLAWSDIRPVTHWSATSAGATGAQSNEFLGVVRRKLFGVVPAHAGTQ